MRALRCFRYNLAQGFKGIFRNSVMSVASVLVLVSCMIILGTFYVVLVNIDENFQNINNLNVIEVRMPVSSSTEQIDAIGVELNKICKNSKIVETDAVFVSKEEHLELFHELYKDQAWSSFFTEELNPLRPSYKITFTNFSDISEVEAIVAAIDEIRYSDGTDVFRAEDIDSCIGVYRNVTGIKQTLTVIGLWLMGIMLLISLFVIMNTIKLGVFARRNEVMFMRYCGATKGFIRTPYLVEGALLGVFSAGVSLVLEYVLYRFVLTDAVKSLSAGNPGGGITISPYLNHLPMLALAFCAIGLFAGLISSSISLKKYLKV